MTWMRSVRRPVALVGVSLVVMSLLSFAFSPVIVASWDWPPRHSLDMNKYRCDSIQSWGSEYAEYCIFREYNIGWFYVGLTHSVWTTGNNFGLDYHSSIIDVEDVNGNYAPGSGSGLSNDPYGYLPRNGQSWEYKNGDNRDGSDTLGWSY
jgi:hypothetical protein